METLAIGSTGSAVGCLQQALAARGLSPGAVDNIFGKRTHNAVLALQTRFGLPITGKVGELEWAALASDRGGPSLPLPFLPTAIPYVEAKFYNRKAVRTVRGIVLHCMEGGETSTRAERCAQYMATLADGSGPKSAHYYGDCDSIVQGVLDYRIAYHAPGANSWALGLEHAGFARQTREEWLDDFGVRMLSLTAQLGAAKAFEHSFPLVFLTAADLQRAERERRTPEGVTTHGEVTKAFPERGHGHMDPGEAFPMDWWLPRAQVAFERMRREAAQ